MFALFTNNGFTIKSMSLNVWHHKFKHPLPYVLTQVIPNCKFPKSIKSKLIFYDSCKLGKSHALPFSLSLSQSFGPLELVPSNIWGLASILFTTSYRYYIIFIDDFSRFCWLYPPKHKLEVASTFTLLKAFVENQFQTLIKKFQIDGAIEYLSLYLIFQKHKIELWLTCPYTSQQNGKVEHRHRTIVKLCLCLFS